MLSLDDRLAAWLPAFIATSGSPHAVSRLSFAVTTLATPRTFSRPTTSNTNEAACWWQASRSRVTLRHLLGHCSGLPDSWPGVRAAPPPGGLMSLDVALCDSYFDRFHCLPAYGMPGPPVAAGTSSARNLRAGGAWFGAAVRTRQSGILFSRALVCVCVLWGEGNERRLQIMGASANCATRAGAGQPNEMLPTCPARGKTENHAQPQQAVEGLSCSCRLDAQLQLQNQQSQRFE